MRPRETRLSSFEPMTPAAAPQEATTGPAALTVTEAVSRANRALGDALPDVWVKGEVSGFKAWSTGNWYFSLKDDRSLLQCMMSARDNARMNWTPKDGDEILARGGVSVYAQKGNMQLYVRDMQPFGKGAQQLAFEALKRKLEAEGLFAPARKRALPTHPRTVGVVTSLQGAVLRDIVRTIKRRNPAIRILVVGTRVQGDDAPPDIVRGIERHNAAGLADVLIVGRGGGSVDDLWCWNDERVARAVAASAIPVISAVGHETDFTLCDFASDRRASTPTAAAELAAPDASALLKRIGEREARLARALRALVPNLRQDVDELVARGAKALRTRVARQRELLGEKAARLDALSPLQTLARGYAVVRRDGRVVRRVEDAPVGADVEVVLRDGRVHARVTKIGGSDDGQEG